MPIGDINLDTVKIGSLDLVQGGQAMLSHMDIYENILDPTGPKANIRIVDPTDSIGKNRINGGYDQDIEIKFGLSENTMGSGTIGFKLKPFKNSDQSDRSDTGQGSGHSKLYTIRGVSAESLNANGNKVKKSFNDQTSNMVKKVLEENFKTKLQIDIDENTDGKRRLVFNNEDPRKVLKKLNHEHVSSQNQSSLFALFQTSDGNGNMKYKFSTFEKLFQQAPVVTLKQSATLNSANASESDKQNSIIWFKAPETFNAQPRASSKPVESTINMTTHQPTYVPPKNYSFNVPGQPVYNNQASYTREQPVKYVHSMANNKQPHKTSEAKTKRTAFLSHLAQNSVQMEIPGNPSIKLGSMINLDIPKKSDTGNEAGETQINGKFLVVGIRHKVKPAGQTPRYTMVIEAVSASYNDGGNGSA